MPQPTSAAVIAEVKLLLAQHRSYRDIADSVGCCSATIGNIAAGKIKLPAPIVVNRAVEFKRVMAYFCGGCKAEVVFSPCVACRARNFKRTV